MNYLVACGGTGAHIALALVRLHVLGAPLKIFHSGTDPLPFPDLFLVDQDAGNGIDKDNPTAWQALRSLIARHPCRKAWKNTIGRDISPSHVSVSPLPVGIDRRWYAKPNHKLATRFSHSPFLDLLPSPEQQEIDYSLGMMASPAVGSLLFKLKQHDKNDGGTNYDQGYGMMLTRCSSGRRVVIAGSAIGGTGASVTPTLADQCTENGANVMAIMVHRWFTFREDGIPHEDFEKAQKRNRDMKQNAASGLASYGQNLANRVPTVIVGAPESALCERRYTGDNQQPIRNSYIHVVAALSALRYYDTYKAPEAPGLYGMSASNTTQLTGDIPVWGSGSLQDLIDKGTALVTVLRAFSKAFRKKHTRKLAPIKPAIFREVVGTGESPTEVADELDSTIKDYDKCLEWLKSLGLKHTRNSSRIRNFTRESRSAERLRSESFLPPGRRDQLGIETIALGLFNWTARWIADEWTPENRAPGDSDGGYWPPQREMGLAPPWGATAGDLVQINQRDTERTIDSFCDMEDISQNGWPHPLATAEHFRFQLRVGSGEAGRKFGILLAGLTTGTLRLESLDTPEDDGGPSLASMISTYSAGMFKGFASSVLRRNNDDRIVGFNTPHTLLCPVPDLDDSDWQTLWHELTDSYESWHRATNWGLWGERARGCNRRWVESLRDMIDPELPPWARTISSPRSYAFKAGHYLWVYWGSRPSPVNIPVPADIERKIERLGLNLEVIDYTELCQQIPSFRTIAGDNSENFTIIENIPIPDYDATNPLRLIWQEHLDALQKEREIFTWDIDREQDQLYIQRDLEKIFRVDRIRVIDKNAISITTCFPLRQCLAPGFDRQKSRVIYPDLPVLPEYVGLVRASDGGNVAKRLIEGVADAGVIDLGELPERNDDSVSWTLKLEGREDLVTIRIRCQEDERAHWMVWPRFRPRRGLRPWRAYYVYSHATRPDLDVGVLYADDTDRLATVPADPVTAPGPAKAVKFSVAERRHVGGAPIAFCAYDRRMRQNVGVYLVKLKGYDRQGMPWDAAVDFGSSHTVAATRENNQQDGKPINLLPELISGREQGLSLHISHDWHEALPRLESWRPTYTKAASRMIPSEIITAKPLDGLTSAIISQWEPLTDYAIPTMEPKRADLPDHIISGFKWSASQRQFWGSEQLLREMYLGMALELFVADLTRSRGSLPEKVRLTFTYPLRSAKTAEISAFGEAIKVVIARSEEDLGCTFELKEGIGLYSESHAAKGGRGRIDEVVLVGDLGGGTLDLLISTYDHQEPGDRIRARYEDAADSALIGGNVLIDHIANNATDLLPANGGWDFNNASRCATQLRAWIRSQGSHKLFGARSEGSYDRDLGLRGFERASDGNAARQLIDRYFWLISDYMARSIVAYISKCWWPNAPDHARRRGPDIVVQLRGNGWRLWYDKRGYKDDLKREYGEIQRKIGERVSSCAKPRWDEAETPPERNWVPPDETDTPKIGPVCKIVGRVLSPNDALDNSISFPLIDFELHKPGQEPRHVGWFEPLPITNARNAITQIGEITPPLLMSDPGKLPVAQITSLESFLVQRINEKLREFRVLDGDKLNIPLSAFVWEGGAFKSPQFTNGH